MNCTDETTPPQEDSFEDEERQKDNNNKLLPLPAELQSPKMIIEEQMDKVVTKLDPYNKLSAAEEENEIKDSIVSDAIDTLQKNTDEFVQPAAKNDIYPMDDGSSLLERVIPEAITTTTIAKERFIVRPTQGDIYSTWMDVTHTSVHKRDEQDDTTAVEESNGHGKGDESIVLDIAGYKTGGDEDNWEDEKRRHDAETIVKKEIINHLFLNKEHDDILCKADVEEAVKDQVVPQDDNEKTEVGDDNEKTQVEEVQEVQEEAPKRSLWGWGTRRQATNDSFDIPTSPPVVPVEEQAKKNNNLEMEQGTTYRIEMSLCGFSAFGRDAKENATVFDQHITTYDNFTHNPNMLNDKRLVFRYEGRYYAAGHTGPLFTSLLLFKKPLEDAAEDDEKVSDSRESYQFGKGWRQWLSRSSVAAPTGTIIENEQNKSTTTPAPTPVNDEQKETTTFTTTTTTTSVGWSADHVHPGQEQSEPFPGPPRKVYAKTLRLTSDQLKSLNLKKGVNTISFSVSSAYQGTATCAAKIFYWDYGISVVISDIDGTITKSDTLGHVFTMIGKDWTHMGVAKLYTDIANNGYHFLYLTSRAIGQADYTRDYLKKVVQDKYQLPDGPVIMSPDRLFTSLHREVIIRKPEVFKMACLRDVQRLFGGRDPFYAGFGNRITDARSYRSVNVPTSRIFTIDPYGDLKLELLLGFKSSYIHLNDLVDQIFPPINRVVNEEYNDWNYWKSPFPEIDIPELDIPLEPTSPKPKPIKPDPSVLPPSSVVSAPNSSRGLLRSFTSRSDSSSSVHSNHSTRKLSTSSSTPNTFLKSRTTNDDSLANDTDVTSDQKASAAISAATDNNDSSSIISTSPDSVSGSIMNKMTSGFGGVRSTLSRTFLSSSSSAQSDSGVTTPPIVEEDETSKKEDVHEEEEEDDSKKIQEDVDSLLDDIDMDDIPFI